jgi:hypothetical protein
LPQQPSSRVRAQDVEWLALLECANPYSDAPRLGELIRKPMDWSNLLALAEEHGMLPLLAARLRLLDEAIVPPQIREKLRDWQRAQAVFTLSLEAALFRLLNRFAASGIEVLLTKGPVLAARCYGDPGGRQYADLDLIVRGRDIQCSTEAMIALGYHPKVPLQAIQAKKVPGEYVFRRRDTRLLIELHTEHTFRYHPRPLPVEKLFERRAYVRCDGHDVPAPSVEDELILISIHAAKHFWTRLMWIADVAALVTRQNVDWNRLTVAAREVGAERMLRLALQLAGMVFRLRLPAQVVSHVHSDATLERVAAQIAHRLPLADSAALGLFGRAAFRMKMCPGVLEGAVYLLRLSLSPTEEDWVSGSEEKRSWLLDAIQRPFRLARKYGREGRT